MSSRGRRPFVTKTPGPERRMWCHSSWRAEIVEWGVEEKGERV
jgi:hypothetical protein